MEGITSYTLPDKVVQVQLDSFQEKHIDGKNSLLDQRRGISNRIWQKTSTLENSTGTE